MTKVRNNCDRAFYVC